MSDEPGIADLVLHFRTPDSTLACLHSLASEGIRHIVLVDNSEDGDASLRQMGEGLGALKQEGVHIDVLEPGRNLGFGAGVAEGLRILAHGPAMHVLLINSAATLAPNSLASMAALLDAHGVVAPLLSGQASRAALSSFTRYRPPFALLYPSHPDPGHIANPSGCCLPIRADQRRMDFFDREFFPTAKTSCWALISPATASASAQPVHATARFFTSTAWRAPIGCRRESCHAIRSSTWSSSRCAAQASVCAPACAVRARADCSLGEAYCSPPRTYCAAAAARSLRQRRRYSALRCARQRVRNQPPAENRHGGFAQAQCDRHARGRLAA